MLMLLISFSFHTGAGIDDPASRHGTTGISRKLLTNLAFGDGPGVTPLGSVRNTIRYVTGSTTATEQKCDCWSQTLCQDAGTQHFPLQTGPG